jgi:holo-[acyl-carrier protein] synthase
MGHGVDLVEVRALERAIRRSGAHFMRRVYTPAELQTARGPRRLRRLAAVFAGKEAVLKACGLGLGEGIALTEIELVADARGRASVVLERRADGRDTLQPHLKVLVSMAESPDYGLAYAVALGQQLARTRVR